MSENPTDAAAGTLQLTITLSIDTCVPFQIRTLISLIPPQVECGQLKFPFSRLSIGNSDTSHLSNGLLLWESLLLLFLNSQNKHVEQVIV